MAHENEIISFDVETTGLQPLTERVIELAAARWRDGEVVETFTTFINPGKPIPPESRAIHGITDADVADAPAMAKVLKDFQAFAGDSPLLAHNAGFDIGFMAVECARARIKVRETKVLDTLALARLAYPQSPSHRLDRLATALRLNARESHRALADAITAGRLWIDAKSRLGEVPESCWMTWHAGLARKAPPKLAPVVEALQYGGFVHLEYADRDGRGSNWQVQPLAFLELTGKGYLYAHSPEVNEDRTFRLDRISKSMSLAPAQGRLF